MASRAVSLDGEARTGPALGFDRRQGGVGPAAFGRPFDRLVNLAKAVVEVGDAVGRHFDPGRKGRVLRLDGRLGRAALPHVGGHKLGIDAARVDDDKPANGRNEREAPDSGRDVPAARE